MAKSKNVRREPEKTLWKRWKLWLTRNEKVLWVGLLLLIAPLFAFTGPVESFFRPTPDNMVHTVYFGKEVSLADLQRASRFVEALRRIAPSALGGAAELLLSGQDFGFDPYKYYLYREKAARLGIRVSDTELGQRIHELWRESEASRLASEEILSSADGTNQQQLRFQFMQLRIQKQKELTDRGAFDSASWKTTVESAGQLKLKAFEEMLRELFTIVKLQEYVASSVKVGPEEVYDEFVKDRQKRRLSWVTWTPPEELSRKVSAAATEQDLEAYFEENKASFYRPLAVRASYVIVPESHFAADAEKNITDEDLEKHYDSNKNEYRTAAILADEALFTLRTAQEQKEYEEALFKPLEEVKEDVREKVLESKTSSEMNAFTNNVLRTMALSRRRQRCEGAVAGEAQGRLPVSHGRHDRVRDAVRCRGDLRRGLHDRGQSVVPRAQSTAELADPAEDGDHSAQLAPDGRGREDLLHERGGASCLSARVRRHRGGGAGGVHEAEGRRGRGRGAREADRGR